MAEQKLMELVREGKRMRRERRNHVGGVDDDDANDDEDIEEATRKRKRVMVLRSCLRLGLRKIGRILLVLMMLFLVATVCVRSSPTINYIYY